MCGVRVCVHVRVRVGGVGSLGGNRTYLISAAEEELKLWIEAVFIVPVD